MTGNRGGVKVVLPEVKSLLTGRRRYNATALSAGHCSRCRPPSDGSGRVRRCSRGMSGHSKRARSRCRGIGDRPGSVATVASPLATVLKTLTGVAEVPATVGSPAAVVTEHSGPFGSALQQLRRSPDHPSTPCNRCRPSKTCVPQARCSRLISMGAIVNLIGWWEATMRCVYPHPLEVCE
jgi:hypothetical protein